MLFSPRMPRGLALLPLVAACAAPFSYTRPKIGERAFYEVSTPHILLVSDMAEDDARALGEALEGLWVSLADNYDLVVPGQPRPKQVFRAVVFDDCDDFQVFVHPKKNIAGFVVLSKDFLERPLVVGCRAREGDPSRVFLHELAHAFNHHFFAQTPSWLEEGLAQYFETLQIRRGQVTLGLVPLVALAHRRDVRSGTILVGDMSGRLPTLDEILAMTPAEFYGEAAGGEAPQHYAAAWVLVHLLQSSKQLQGRFVAYLSQLAAGQSLDDAWASTFGDVPRAELAKQYADYINRNELLYWKSDYRRPDVASPTSRRLRAGEAHAVWLHLLLATKRNAVLSVHEQLDAAERADPSWTGLELWRGIAAHQLGETDADQHLRRAADADPGDRLARLALLRRAVDAEDANRLRALDADARVLEAGAASGIELATLAVFWTQRGQTKRAVPLAVRAVQIDHACATCYEAAALSMFRVGKPDQAVTLQRRAVSLIERHEGRADATAARERLASYEAAAGRSN